MNKEQQELLDDAYKSYENYCQSLDINDYDDKDTFIKGVKLNYRYSNRWGLKIEERELSLLERYELMKKLDNWVSVHYKEPKTMEYMDKHNIPTKLITITYNNEKIESYE
jgi:hypothetical protein